MTDLNAEEISKEKWFQGLVLNVDLVLDTQVSYKILGLPKIKIPLRGLWRLATSKEVTLLLLILCTLIAAIEILSAINGLPLPKITAIAVCLSPMLVTLATWVLLVIRSQIALVFGSEARIVKVHSVSYTFLAASLVHFGATLLSASNYSAPGTFLTFAQNTTAIANFAFLVVGYTALAEVIQLFIFKYLVPIGGPNWARVTQTERKPFADWKICRALNDFYVASRADQVVIGKQQIALDQLVSISAQGNYVQVSCLATEYFERVPLTKAIQVLPTEFGLMLHRSNWVAYGAIVSYARHGDECMVKLTSGEVINVARSRVKDVSKVLAKMGLERTR